MVVGGNYTADWGGGTTVRMWECEPAGGGRSTGRDRHSPDALKNRRDPSVGLRRSWIVAGGLALGLVTLSACSPAPNAELGATPSSSASVSSAPSTSTPSTAGSWESLAAGYAGELGFTLYVPQGEALAEGTMTQPVRVAKFVDERGPGVSIDYDRFALREYKSAGVLTAKALEPYLDVAWWAEKGITAMATIADGTVLGRPAVVARYANSGAIVFQPAPGVIARLEPWGRVINSTPEQPMPVEEALAVAERFGPK
jgi:hypothetical protein